MHFRLCALAVAAGLLASPVVALSSADIPTDQPVSALLSSAQTHLSRGETSEALVYYDAAIARDPTNYLTFFKRATTYLSLGRTSQATDDFNKVLNLKPGFEGAHLQLAKIKSRSADWNSAREEYLAANKSKDSEEITEINDAEAAASSAHTAQQAGQWEECIQQASIAIQVASRVSSLRELRSQCRFEMGEEIEGMSDLKHVLNLKPGNIQPHVVISATTYYGLGDLDGGIGQVKKCLHSDPDSKVCKKLHKQQKAISKHLARAEGQLKREQTATAGKTLVGTEEEQGLLNLVKDQVDELRKEGYIPAKARIRLYERLVEMVCQAYSESNHRDANQYCNEVAEANPDSFWSLLHNGKTLLKQEDYEAAIRAFEKAAEVGPEYRGKVNTLLQKAQIALKRSKTKDYYKVLGVANDADERQIKTAYRKASKLFHPDKAAKQGIKKEDAEKKMASINEAYEVLGNPELRARFDRGDDPNSQEQGNPFQGSPFGGHPFGGAGHPFFQQNGGGGGGGGGRQFKFQFNGQGGGGPFGF